MKGKLVFWITAALGGIIGATIGEIRIRRLKSNQNDIDAKLEKLRQEETELLSRLNENRQKSEEEIKKMHELISAIRELGGIDPTEINVQIDPE